MASVQHGRFSAVSPWEDGWDGGHRLTNGLSVCLLPPPADTTKHNAQLMRNNQADVHKNGRKGKKKERNLPQNKKRMLLLFVKLLPGEEASPLDSSSLS